MTSSWADGPVTLDHAIFDRSLRITLIWTLDHNCSYLNRTVHCKKKTNKKRALTQCGPATPYGDTKCATLAQLMVCGLSQCRLIISEVLWHSPEGNVTGYATDIYPCNGVGIVSLRLQPNLPRANQPINNQWHWYCVILVLLFEVTQSWSDIRTRTNRDQITKHAPNMATCQNYLRRSQNEPIMYRVINTGIKTNYWYLFAISKKKMQTDEKSS